MSKLTKAEEEVMLALWKLGEGTVRDVLNKLDDPDTPYTTVSTVIRVLEKKEFVAHRAIGTTHLYYPLLEKEVYMKQSLSGFLNKYFDGSFTNLTSFFASENDISMSDLKEMIEEVKEDLSKERKAKNKKQKK